MSLIPYLYVTLPFSALKRSSAALAVMAHGGPDSGWGGKDRERDRARAHTAAAGLRLLSRQLARKLYGGGGRGREEELAVTAKDISSTKGNDSSRAARAHLSGVATTATICKL